MYDYFHLALTTRDVIIRDITVEYILQYGQVIT